MLMPCLARRIALAVPGFAALLAGAALVLMASVAHAAPRGRARARQDDSRHEKAERDCTTAILAQQSGQDGLCLKWHEDIDADPAQEKPIHGRIKRDPCSVCHSRPQGRDANIMALNDSVSISKQTNFALRRRAYQNQMRQLPTTRRSSTAMPPRNCSRATRRNDSTRDSSARMRDLSLRGELERRSCSITDRDTKIPLRAASLAFRAELSLVLVILLVAREAVRGAIAVLDLRVVAAGAFGFDMRAAQREVRLLVIERLLIERHDVGIAPLWSVWQTEHGSRLMRP